MGQADAALLQELRNGSLIPLAQLFQVNQSSPYYNEANKTGMFYAESWALTHYLMLGDRMAHRAMLNAYLDALDRGKSQEESVAVAFGDLKKLQADLQSYVSKASFLYMKMPPPARIGEAELQLRTLSEAEAEAYRGGFAAVRGRTADASAILEEALHLDASVALTYQYLAVAEFSEGNIDKALESASKAIALDPKNSSTRYLRAFLSTRGRGMSSPDSQIEEDLRQAIAISPDFAPSYSLLAMYLAVVDRSLDEALALAQKAVAFEPASSTYQLALAQVLARQEKFDEAGRAVARAAAWARDPAEKANAESFQSYLQQARQFQHESPSQTGASESDNSDENESPGGQRSFSARNGSISPRAATVRIQTNVAILSDARGTNFMPYLQTMMEAVNKSLGPNVARMTLLQPRTLSFELAISKDGKIATLKMVSSSGDAALDQATQDGIAASSPLPTLPHEFKGQNLRLRFGLSYNPQASSPQ